MCFYLLGEEEVKGLSLRKGDLFRMSGMLTEAETDSENHVEYKRIYRQWQRMKILKWKETLFRNVLHAEIDRNSLNEIRELLQVT